MQFWGDATQRIDPGLAIGPGSAPGTFTLYALLAPTAPADAVGQSAIVGEFVFHVARRAFRYRTRHAPASQKAVSGELGLANWEPNSKVLAIQDTSGCYIRLAAGL